MRLLEGLMSGAPTIGRSIAGAAVLTVLGGLFLWWVIVRDIGRRKTLDAFFTAAPAGLAILDAGLRYLQVNETLAQMNGLSVQEHLGKRVGEVLPKLAPVVEPILQGILTSGEPALNIEVSGETPLQPGVVRHWVASYFPVTIEGRASKGIGAIVVEITGLKRAEEGLKQLYDEADRRRQEAETFAALLQDLTGSLELDRVLARLVTKARALSQGDLAFLALVEADGQTLTVRAQTGAASSSLPGLALAKGHGMAGKVLETGEPLVTGDYLQDPRFSHDYDAVAQAEGIVAQVAVPILHEGTPLGVLLVARRTPCPFTPGDVQVLTRLADVASLACHQALLYRQATYRAETLEHLFWVGQALTQSLALPETLGRIVHAAHRLLLVEYARLRLWDETTRCLILAAWAGGETLPRHQVFRPGEGVAGTVAATRRALIVNDYQTFPHRLPELTAVTAAMAVPLLIEGRFIGTLSVGSTQPGRAFTAEDLKLLELLAQPAASALENARLHEQVKRHAEELERKVEERTQALKVANAQLAAASHHKSEFLASMSHELRTPLNSILGFAELLQDQTFGPLNEKQQRYVHNILVSGKHLVSLINDILDLSKVEAGKLEFRPEPFDLKEALEGGLTVVASAASKKNLTLSLEVDQRLSTLTADPARFKQILYNLLSNAVKFTPEGGRVTVTARPVEDAFVEIRVQDTGIGIRPEDLPKLFQEFTQLGSPLSKPYEGTGLGLALTKKLVERQGGRIWAESEGEGRGSTFTFLLPWKGKGAEE